MDKNNFLGEKKMKNNRILRVAAFLLIAVLITACTISGTFAKYVSGDEDSDTARVAAWGVNVVVYAGDASDATAFANEYGATVKSANTEDVIAPGTSGKLATVTVSGTPEVAAVVSANATLTLSNWTVDGAAYCPIVFSIGDTDYSINDGETVNEFAARVETAIETALAQGEITPGTSVANTLTVDWSWAFSTSEANDIKDTALGTAANAPTIEFSLSVSVEQKTN